VRTWVDVTLAIILVAVCSQLALPTIRAARRRDALQPLAHEAHALYAAFQQYHARNGEFPDIDGTPAFDPDTLEPLRRRGYYGGKLDEFLVGGRIDAYDAPDDRGPNGEFWIEMTLASDPDVRVLIATSDDAPLGRGIWTDGVFIVRAGRAEPL
jgi:hypothetical protein